MNTFHASLLGHGELIFNQIKPLMETLLDALNAKYPAYSAKIAERFLDASGLSLDWGNITKSTLSKFCAHLQKLVSRTTTKNYCAMLKSVLALYDDEHPLPRGWRDALKVKSEDSEQVYLSETEIQRLLEYIPSTRNEDFVLTAFLLGCLTGARHSDYIKFSADNISEDGSQLRYTSQKTRTSATLPVAPAVPRLIEHMSGLADIQMADSTFNDSIRRICCKCGICTRMKLYRRGKDSSSPKWEFVSSHTARRSFASNLYLRGCDVLSISLMMGHASVDMTRGYIVCGLRNLPESVTGYFSQFK